jgi:DNA-directed RNA polymerase subunit D
LIRHALFADVPVQAVSRVTFYAWDGLTGSEFIAHRLGQLPIRGLGPLRFEICVRAPARAPLTWVTAADIVGDGGRVVKGDVDAYGKLQPFLLVPLLAGQRVHVVCETELGTGRRHTTWSSVLPTMRPDPERDDACDFIVETTGALPPPDAWRSALTSTRDCFARLARLE